MKPSSNSSEPLVQKLKRKLRERFLRYDSWVYPIYFWKRFPLYRIPTLMMQRFIIYTFLGRQNRILPVHFPPLKNIHIRSFHSFLGGLRYFGWWENELRNMLRTDLPKSKSFIEIGAMEGFYEIIARKLNPACMIVAVEPEPGARELVRNNFLLNGMDIDDHTTFCEKFVTNVSGPKNISIAELIRNLPQPLFLLMDIDGGEEKALQSGIESLRTMRCRMIIETHSPKLESSCVAILRENGFRVTIRYNAWWRILLPEERPIPHNRWLYATNISL